jgi:hypothetical protein
VVYDTIQNDGAIEATSTARSGSADVAVAVAGVAVALANSTSLSNAAAIDSGVAPDETDLQNGTDKDLIVNRGLLTINANAFALSLPVAVSGAGVAVAGNSVWDGGTTADATAVGITTRAGDDSIDNHGVIAADADATSGTASVSVAVAGFAASVATSTANAIAAAIDAGDGADRVTNIAKVTADATALAGTGNRRSDACGRGRGGRRGVGRRYEGRGTDAHESPPATVPIASGTSAT